MGLTFLLSLFWRGIMKAITINHQDLVEAIIRYTKDNDYPPSVRDLCKILNIKSTQTMQKHLDLLRAQGLVAWQDKQPRTLRVVQQ
jgi:SOS-response transcriptional repressor LexA